MICINKDILITNTMDLNSYIEKLNDETYDTNSEKIVDCIVQFLLELWSRIDRIEKMAQKYINSELMAIAYISIDETEDLSKIDVQAVTRNKEIEVKQSDVFTFNEFCEKGLKNFTPLYDRFFDLDLL